MEHVSCSTSPVKRDLSFIIHDNMQYDPKPKKKIPLTHNPTESDKRLHRHLSGHENRNQYISFSIFFNAKQYVTLLKRI